MFHVCGELLERSSVVTSALEIRKILGGIVLTILWICCFLFIKSTLVIDFGNGVTFPFQTFVVLIGLLVIVFYHIFYRSSAETNKLSWTSVATLSWLALIIFYPFKDPTNFNGGAVGFFTLIGGLGICVLWVRFFSDEIIPET